MQDREAKIKELKDFIATQEKDLAEASAMMKDVQEIFEIVTKNSTSARSEADQDLIDKARKEIDLAQGAYDRMKTLHELTRQELAMYEYPPNIVLKF